MENLIAIVLVLFMIVAFVFVVWKAIKLIGRIFKVMKGRDKSIGLSKEPKKLVVNQSFGVKVVGVTFYQDALHKLWHKTRKENESVATLIPDDKNRHDSNAIKVLVKGMRIGHLSREDAARYRKELGTVTSQCNARLYGFFECDEESEYDEEFEYAEEAIIYARLNCKKPFRLVAKLGKSGVTRKQAEAQADKLDVALRDTVATKHDIDLIRRDMKELEQRLKHCLTFRH